MDCLSQNSSYKNILLSKQVKTYSIRNTQYTISLATMDGLKVLLVSKIVIKLTIQSLSHSLYKKKNLKCTCRYSFICSSFFFCCFLVRLRKVFRFCDKFEINQFVAMHTQFWIIVVELISPDCCSITLLEIISNIVNEKGFANLFT